MTEVQQLLSQKLSVKKSLEELVSKYSKDYNKIVIDPETRACRLATEKDPTWHTLGYSCTEETLVVYYSNLISFSISATGVKVSTTKSMDINLILGLYTFLQDIKLF